MKRLLGLLLVMGVVGCDLSVARLEDKGANLTKNEQGEIIEVSLWDTEITDAGLVHLKEQNNLEYLWLDGTKVTDAGVAELKKALPNCNIGGVSLP